jgi:hypothetical protein
MIKFIYKIKLSYIQKDLFKILNFLEKYLISINKNYLMKRNTRRTF